MISLASSRGWFCVLDWRGGRQASQWVRTMQRDRSENRPLVALLGSQRQAQVGSDLPHIDQAETCGLIQRGQSRV